MEATQSLDVKDNPRHHRFEVLVDQHLAFAAYELHESEIIFTHTVVPEQLQGRGVATELIHVGLAWARSHRLQVTPRCPFFLAFMKRHVETHDLLSPEGRELVGV